MLLTGSMLVLSGNGWVVCNHVIKEIWSEQQQKDPRFEKYKSSKKLEPIKKKLFWKTISGKKKTSWKSNFEEDESIYSLHTSRKWQKADISIMYSEEEDIF